VILLITRVVQFLVVLLVVRFLVRFLVSVVHGYREAGPPATAATELVRDRVCGTFLPRARALMVIVDGREQHFCSAGCRDRALGPASP
jgi:hypothetical protein